MLAGGQTTAGGLSTNQPNLGVFEKGVENAHGVGTAADTGNDGIGQLAKLLQTLLAGFGADHRLKITHQHGVRMGAGNGADNVIGVIHIRHPVAHGFT